ncbi:MAG: tetratricopeptide repeat protein [Polyangiaceae bacterium]
MIKHRGWAAWLVAAALGVSTLGACGGSTPPPSGPTDPPPLDDDDGGGGEVPASSAEVEAAKSSIQAGDFDSAKAKLDEALAKNPDDAQANYYYGVVVEQGGDTTAAKEHYKKALAADPKLPEAAVNLSGILLEVDKDADGALAVVEPALKATPGHPGLLMNHALILEALGRADEALAAYGKASAANPKDSALRFAYADMLASAGKKEEAKKVLLSIETDDVKILGAIGAVLGKVEAFADCVGVLDKAIEKDPLPQLYVRRAACKNAMKDVDGATADYRAAIEKEPKSAAGHYYLGKHLAAAGKKKEATAALKEAIKLDPEGKVGQEAKALLKSL